MPRVRESNVVAAQWSPNGSIGTGDLTIPGTSIYGANVFGPDEQRQRLPKAIFRQLQATIDRGEPLDPGLADARQVARHPGQETLRLQRWLGSLAAGLWSGVAARWRTGRLCDGRQGASAWLAAWMGQGTGSAAMELAGQAWHQAGFVASIARIDFPRVSIEKLTPGCFTK